MGNIPGELLRTTGYTEPAIDTEADKPRVIQAYRAPHIPVVSDRYGLYLFEQTGRIEFAELTGSITNFDYTAFLKAHRLGRAQSFQLLRSSLHFGVALFRKAISGKRCFRKLADRPRKRPSCSGARNAAKIKRP